MQHAAGGGGFQPYKKLNYLKNHPYFIDTYQAYDGGNEDEEHNNMDETCLAGFTLSYRMIIIKWNVNGLW